MAKADTEQTRESQLIQRLKQYGYEVTSDAKVKGASGTEHTFTMLAHKDDGLFNYDIAIGLSVSQHAEVGLGAIFSFDEKTTDVNIPDKVFIAIPKLGTMATNFARQQHIKVFDEESLSTFCNAAAAPPAAKQRKPIEFSSKDHILKSLTEHGYRIEEQVKVKGMSGAEHAFDILAYSGDDLITQPLSIDFLSADNEIGIEPVSLLDAKIRDTGIIRSVLVASPKLSDEAKQFANEQQIKVFEADKITPEKSTSEPQTHKKATAQSSKESPVVNVAESAPPEPVAKSVPPEPVTTSAPSEPVATRQSAGGTRLKALTQAPTSEALNLIPEKLARKYNVLPLTVDGNTLHVAMSNPDDILAIQAIAAKTKMRIEPTLATPLDLQQAIDFNYKAFGEIAKQFGQVTPTSTETILADRAATEVIADDSPIAKALNLLVEEAVKSRASDIHIEPEIDKLRVRYRIDGILHEVTSLPPSAHGPLVSRIKILSNMNIADPRRPQDGQFSFVSPGRDIDIRVATISTVHGETAVLRLLDKSMAVLSLPQIGFLPESQEKFERMLMAPYGMLLLSGPTGAGKTTTLYAAVNSLDKVGRNIITIEDPVEYRFQGINQIQTNPKAGITFASGLRAIVRLDPDVILVGEIRDSETADIATQSALTGHLVLSSVHANDTVGVLFRLIDLGVEPFLICSAVICIVAQRMVRRICPHCAQKAAAPLVEQAAYQRETDEECTEFDYGVGCKSCTFTGYLGRTGIFEILSMSDKIKHAIVTGASATEIRALAIEEGMVTLAQDGMRKAKAGITTPYEVLRNAYSIGD